MNGSAEIVTLLPKAGADVKAANNAGETAITLAASRGYAIIIEQLKTAGGGV